MRKWIIAACMLALAGCASWSQNKEKSELYLRMGNAFIEEGNYPNAIVALQKAQELDTTNAAVPNSMGQALFMRERYDLAEKQFRKAVAMNPKYSDARNNLARVLIEEGKYAEADKELTLVLNDLTYSGVDKAFTNYGLSKFNQKQYAAAQEAFLNVLKTKSDDCWANSYYGRAFFEEKKYAQATEALDRAIGFCQKNLIDEPHYYSALAYYRVGDKSKSIARFEEIIRYYPDGKYRDKAKGMLDLIRKGQ
ncbi:lipopolysaccharide assembly protein LapB [Bdellovibrio sp. KM01]|uniref:tetratricopeptide repeat protein n=1 Tax=Bdellovibrio sp. KM01 TaxID=2748865 RepID=UPI0015EA7656|nr:tetratricopeptide repeat protein [Bdellovibrio sp. KM01]QLY25402.1 tetratricopeptide repeat protein [Bdellovibrio sp. KM01]